MKSFFTSGSGHKKAVITLSAILCVVVVVTVIYIMSPLNFDADEPVQVGSELETEEKAAEGTEQAQIATSAPVQSPQPSASVSNRESDIFTLNITYTQFVEDFIIKIDQSYDNVESFGYELNLQAPLWDGNAESIEWKPFNVIDKAAGPLVLYFYVLPDTGELTGIEYQMRYDGQGSSGAMSRAIFVKSIAVNILEILDSTLTADDKVAISDTLTPTAKEKVVIERNYLYCSLIWKHSTNDDPSQEVFTISAVDDFSKYVQQSEQDSYGDNVVSNADSGLLCMIQNDNYLLVNGADIVGGINTSKEFQIQSDYCSDISIIARRGSPNGTDILLVIGNSAVNLLDYFVPCADAFDDFGEFDAEYNIQISVIDLDKDGSEEILVSIGNGLTSLETAVFTIGSDDVF